MKTNSPSQFMKQRRPELYSDTEDRVAYSLEAPLLGYHLESITSNNATHAFEVFCRKLCERTICPNLRAHTGPDGGGDSKADTETYPVAKEIAELYYVGEQAAASERWAFAFSAKKTWSSKVRDDVKGIVETERNYKRIFFVTSRPARDKDRARIEDELSKKYGIPVTIHDRSWIVKEIIEKDRKDLAFNYLGIGEIKADPLRLGPTDYSQTQQLTEIEKSIDDPETYKGMEQQRVTEALLAAKLSRNIESNRTETAGRFSRAIRLAKSQGTYRQQLEAEYESIWAAFWWFDDFQLLKDNYEAFETHALQTDRALDLELLCNLLQLLVNSVIFENMSREECRLDERTASLKKVLVDMASDRNRPNNALEAQTSLLGIRLNQVIFDNLEDDIEDIWSVFLSTLEKAAGLIEFNADRFVKMVELAGNVAENDPTYNVLVDKTSEFVWNRKGEAEGALILLKRAQKLDFENNFEMIRLLGKAAIGLSKQEYREHLIEALHLLVLAYRSAGLLWAARANCSVLVSNIVIEGEEQNQISASFFPAMKVWAWIALELRHIPDFLYAIQLLNGALATLPLNDESKAKVGEDIIELDMALGRLFLTTDESDLIRLGSLPDILKALGLDMARIALLYTLGHTDTLRADGSLPESESDEDVKTFFSKLLEQLADQILPHPLTLNTKDHQILSTNILGMTVKISFVGNVHSILVAETVLGSLEAFFSTAIEQKIFPHTESFQLEIIEYTESISPNLKASTEDTYGTINWPSDLSPNNLEKQSEIQKFWAEVSAHVLVTCCVLENAEIFVKNLYGDEAVQQRMAMVAIAPTSYHRVASQSVSRLSNWQEAVQSTYALRDKRPELAYVPARGTEGLKSDNAVSTDDKPAMPNNHRAYEVRSVIDIHAWNKAQWKGVVYAQFEASRPSCMAFLFENREAGKKLFEHWRKRFGKEDTNEEIFLSIIQQLPKQNKHHYCVLATSKLPDPDSFTPQKVTTMVSRYLIMTPDSSTNLEGFLESYNKLKSFYIAPAFLDDSGKPELLFDLSILKRNLTVKLAVDVGEHDIQAIALKEK